MARVFTTSFSYQGRDYTAVVSLNDAAGTLSVYLPDESLHELLPEGKLTFPVKDGLPTEDKELTAASPDLLDSLVAAIRAHESNKPVPGL